MTHSIKTQGHCGELRNSFLARLFEPSRKNLLIFRSFSARQPVKVASKSAPATSFVIRSNYGYAVLELLFYIAFFVTLSLVVIEAMIIMSGSFKETSIYAELMQNGSIMERMSREIRGSYDISSISAADLVLNTKDNAGANKTVEFLFSGGNVGLLENGTLTGNLNTPNITVTSLAFAQITTAKGKAVKISLTIRDNNDIQGRLENFYDTIVLRGNY